jgi:GNAT superfamily N-acetyltransferase
VEKAIRRGRLALQWLTRPQMVTEARLSQIAHCWQQVSNAGGAVGFPFPPVEREEVLAATEEMVTSLDPLLRRLLIATFDDALAGWLLLSGNDRRLTSHWAFVQRVQTDLAFRGIGVGRALMEETARTAADELGLKSLHIEVRGGAGLEGFYKNIGWTEIGRWPGALRFGDDDYRDNVLMALSLDSSAQRSAVPPITVAMDGAG